ncbi:MAG: SUMF1/EgtB/PvdO family nonheme iron enzyme, partial [Bryobacterales bacterium]|nr:SUMF1/EgtB/PvdO family nonheme iron enzyme [Bryobacterales bacterium]
TLPPGHVRGNPSHPIVNVTIADAMAFAKWAGKRLPTQMEWEKAARGWDGRRYSWGEEANATRANVKDGGAQGIVPVDGFRHGRSPLLVQQAVGNVQEFTADRVPPNVAAIRAFAGLLTPPPTADERWYAVKGGSFRDLLAEAELPLADVVPERYAGADLGFRCARDY